MTLHGNEISPENGYFNSENIDNILIQGDNCRVLTTLQNSYKEKIKCIYIDPPYNNGEKYHYYNDKTDHACWINTLNRVLSLLKPLMTIDGSIWISIDDYEMAYLKVEADKVFGRENFIGTIIWQQRKSRENRAALSCNHEYVLVYARNADAFRKTRNLLPVEEGFISKKYKNPDNDSRGPWQSVSANVQAGHAVPSQFYTIVSPTGVSHFPPKGRCWIYNEERMKREIAKGNIWFGKDGKNSPRVKKFLCDAKIGLTPETIWLAEEVGTSDDAKKQLMAMFPDEANVFETPKPEGLLKRIIEIASNQNDYVLDCFLGSGTTIAVAHKLKRRYLGIEIGKQMSEIAIRRMNMVIDGEQSGISKEVDWHGGGHFDFYCLEQKQVMESGTTVVFFHHQSNFAGKSSTTNPISNTPPSTITREGHYKQLDFIEVLRQFPERIVENHYVQECQPSYEVMKNSKNDARNVLICLVKPENEKAFTEGTAKIYYTGKRFPSSIALDSLFYFMPYIKRKGVRDLYLIQIARIGTRKEGQPDNDPSDLRLVFEIKFVKRLFDDYKSVPLKIWRTFTDTTTKELFE